MMAALIWAPLSTEAEEAAREAAAEVASAPDRRSAVLPVEVSARVAASFSRLGALEGVTQEFLPFVSPGVVARWQFSDAHGLQTGLSYVRKGAVTVGVDRTESTVDYLNLPLLYRAAPRWFTPTPRVQPYIVLGPYLGVNVGKGGSLANSDIATLDYGATLGVGVGARLSSGWMVDVDVEYSHGFANIVPGNPSEPANRTIIASVSVTFDIGGDYDGDGVPNRRETLACWTEAEDRDGFEDGDGCVEPDNDRDTLADEDDACPTGQPEDIDGYRDWDGCPEDDNDQDGIADASEYCENKREDGTCAPADEGELCQDRPYWSPFARPETDYAKDGKDGAMWNDRQYGCPGQYQYIDVGDSGSRDQLSLRREIDQFDRNAAELSNEHREVLNDVAKFLSHYPWLSLQIRGYATKREKNTVAKDRATQVRQYLIQQGVVEDRLTAIVRGDCEDDESPPRAVAKPEPMSPEDFARLKAIETSVNERLRRGGSASSARYKADLAELADLKRRRKAVREQTGRYERYVRQKQAYDRRRQGDDAQNSPLNRRVTLGIQEP